MQLLDAEPRPLGLPRRRRCSFTATPHRPCDPRDHQGDEQRDGPARRIAAVDIEAEALLVQQEEGERPADPACEQARPQASVPHRDRDGAEERGIRAELGRGQQRRGYPDAERRQRERRAVPDERPAAGAGSLALGGRALQAVRGRTGHILH